jgi:hypothetical protein
MWAGAGLEEVVTAGLEAVELKFKLGKSSACARFQWAGKGVSALLRHIKFVEKSGKEKEAKRAEEMGDDRIFECDFIVAQTSTVLVWIHCGEMDDKMLSRTPSKQRFSA